MSSNTAPTPPKQGKKKVSSQKNCAVATKKNAGTPTQTQGKQIVPLPATRKSPKGEKISGESIMELSTLPLSA